MAPPTLEVPVLVVGGGPTGLSLSLALSQAGIASLLIDKHPTTTHHPKATVVNVRTMELFRQWGVDAEILAGGIPASELRCICWSTTLAGHEIGRIELGADDAGLLAGAKQSPVIPVMCPQDVIEPILRAAAAEKPRADVRFGHALVHSEQDPDGVTAEIVESATGASYRVRCAYLVGCDGRASGVREALGIGLSGGPPLGDMLNIYFRADLRRLVSHRLSPLYWIVNPDTPGVFITLNGTDRWLFNLPYDASRSSPDGFSEDHCEALVRRAIGDAEIPVEILSVDPWQMTRWVAERFREGRAFLAGDSAHQFPPTGGHGMNAGIQDAHNLAWKLAAVIDGWSAPRLLDSYEAERKPIAERLTRESVGNAAAMKGRLQLPPAIEDDNDEGWAIRDLVAKTVTAQRGHFISTGLTLGSGYVSGAVVGPGGGDTESDVERYVPRAVEGHRAPHFPVGEGGRRLSILDLFSGGLVLLTDDGGDAWVDAAKGAAEGSGAPLRCVRVGSDVVDEDGCFATLYRVAPGGAVLVRPDGYILWRCEAPPGDPAGTLGSVLSAVFG